MANNPDIVRAEDEYINLTKFQRGDGCKVVVPQHLTERRIYSYLEIMPLSFGGDGEFWVRAIIQARLNQTVKAELPVVITQSNFPPTRQINKSMACYSQAGGSPVGDAITVKLAQPFTPDTMITVLQPYRINGEWNNVTMLLDDWRGGGLTAWRCWLGVVSSRV